MTTVTKAVTSQLVLNAVVEGGQARMRSPSAHGEKQQVK